MLRSFRTFDSLNVYSRWVNYLALSTGIAIAISCNFVVLQILGEDGSGSAEVAWRWSAVWEILLASVVMVAIIGPILELASLFPGSAGIRPITYATLGHNKSLIVASFYLVLLALIVGIESDLLFKLLIEFVPSSTAAGIITVIFLWIIGVNYFGVTLSERFQRYSTAILWCGGLSLSIIMILVVSIKNPEAYSTIETASNLISEPALFGIKAENIALGVFLFVGVELACQSVKTPTDFVKVIPTAIFSAIVLITVFYLAMAFAVLYFAPSALENGNPLLSFGGAVAGAFGKWIAVMLTILALLTSFNSGLRGASRMLYQLAREGIVEKEIRKLSNDATTPVNAVLVMGVVAAASALLATMLEMTHLMSVISASIVCWVYATLIYASCKVDVGRKMKVKDFYGCKLPKRFRYLSIAVLCFIGTINCYTLFSELRGIILFLVCICIVVSLFQRSVYLRKSQANDFF